MSELSQKDVGRLVRLRSGGPVWTVEKVIHPCIRLGGSTGYKCIRTEWNGYEWAFVRQLFVADVLTYVQEET